MGEWYEWIVELLDADEIDRSAMLRVLLALEILVSSRLDVDAG